MSWPIVIKIVGVLIILLGLLYIVKPQTMKSLLEFFKKGNRIYFAGLLRLVLAAVFLISATECHIPWVIIALGVLMMLGGLLVFVLGPNKIRPILEWWQRQSVILLRVLALIALAMGALVIYAA
jgi:uncharacterized protein YjeT (DUF2065 family)